LPTEPDALNRHDARIRALMRLVREAAVIAFTLLASTESASAESAWLLWLTPIADNPQRQKSGSQERFHTLEECDRHAAVILAELNLMYPTGGLLEARCFLDSVDPRRPSQGMMTCEPSSLARANRDKRSGSGPRPTQLLESVSVCDSSASPIPGTRAE
jgi:hypothetical protein